jgi:hypothetical protein
MKLPGTIVLLGLWMSMVAPTQAQAETTHTEQRQFNASIVDYSKHLSAHFRKVPRQSTQYIVVHTAEAGAATTLQVISQGKHLRGGRRTHGGHAHYVIDRNGRTYRTLDKRYRADHAGKSMWDKQTNLSDISIGIELVGYHHSLISNAQYQSLELLIDILQRIYRLSDNDVLTHSQIAYGGPNPWFRRDHRGRKRCAQNFDRHAAGLTRGWTYDPDVRAGRLMPDGELADILYSSKPVAASGHAQVITASRSAWMIAGERYNKASTTYKLPSGKVIAGNQMNSVVGWNRVPVGTAVTLAGASTPATSSAATVVPVTSLATVASIPSQPGSDGGKSPQITRNGNTPWSLAGQDYKHKSTYYLFPNGTIKNGQEISNWAEIPDLTKVYVGYEGPYRVTSSRPPIVIAGRKYRDAETLYLFPDRRVLPGSEIKNWKRLPRGVRILLPAAKS